MRRIRLVMMVAAICGLLSDAAPASRRRLHFIPATTAGHAIDHASMRGGSVPVSFELNRGQLDDRVRFFSRSAGAGLYLTASDATLTFQGPGDNRSRVLRMRWLGGNQRPTLTGEEERAAPISYFRGSDPKAWVRDIPSYERVRYHAIYPGVDLVFHGRNGGLEYDLIVAPRADPRIIALGFEGASAISLADDGSLIIDQTDRQIRHHPPRIYQIIDGDRRDVMGRYILRGTTVGFDIDAYEPGTPLVIDPAIEFSSTFGGSRQDEPRAIAVDPEGNTYVTGSTASPDFPVSQTAVQRTPRGTDVFVAKLDRSGSRLLYATYMGGGDQRSDFRTTAFESGLAIAVDTAGNVCVTGSTGSTDFPTVNAYRPSTLSTAARTTDAFAFKLDPTGSRLIYSTYLGGPDGASAGTAMAVDAVGNCYAGGNTAARQFGETHRIGPAAGLAQMFVVKFNPAGGVSYSTRFGGRETDRLGGVAIDGSGAVYLTGTARSRDFPIVNAASQPSCPTEGSTICLSAFVAKLDPTGDQLLYSRYLGGSTWDEGTSIAAEGTGTVWVAGFTRSRDLPAAQPPQPAFAGGATDAFVAHLDRSGAVVFITYVGGSGSEEEFPVHVRLDASGNAYVAGRTQSTDIATAGALVEAHPAGPVFRSADRSTTFQAAGKGLSGNVNSLAFDPTDSNRVYAGTEAGVFKTDDSGASWQPRNSGLGAAFTPRVEALAIHAGNPSVVYAATENGTYKTSDGGGRWFPVERAGTIARAVVIAQSQPSTVYVGSVWGVWRTRDGGTTWTKATAGLTGYPGITGGVETIAVHPLDPNRVYAATAGGVFVSTDAGERWSRSGSLTRWIFHLVIDPRAPSTLVATDASDVFRSVDEGATWALVGRVGGPNQGSIGALAFDPHAANTLYAGMVSPSRRSLFRSEDGGTTWKEVPGIVNNERVKALAFDPLRPNLLYVGGELPAVPFVALLPAISPVSGYRTYVEEGRLQGLAVDSARNIYLAIGRASRVAPFDPGNVIVTKVAGFSPPASDRFPCLKRPCLPGPVGPTLIRPHIGRP